MNALAREFASGRGRWWSPSVLFLLSVLVVYAVGVAVGTLERGEPTLSSVAYEPLLFPVLFFYAPPVVAAVAAFRGFSPLSCLALGVSVGVGFAALGLLASLVGTSGNGDSPLWAMSLTFAAIGLITAVVGYALGAAARLAVERLA